MMKIAKDVLRMIKANLFWWFRIKEKYDKSFFQKKKKNFKDYDEFIKNVSYDLFDD